MATKYAAVAAGSTDVTTTLTQLYGYSFREVASSAAVATVLLRKTNSSGDVVIAIEVPANGSETNVVATSPEAALAFNGVIYVDIVAGEVQGSVWGK